RRRLRSADRLSERAMDAGSVRANTPCARSSASLVSVTCCDHRSGFAAPRLRAAVGRSFVAIAASIVRRVRSLDPRDALYATRMPWRFKPGARSIDARERRNSCKGAEKLTRGLSRVRLDFPRCFGELPSLTLLSF